MRDLDSRILTLVQKLVAIDEKRRRIVSELLYLLKLDARRRDGQ